MNLGLDRPWRLARRRIDGSRPLTLFMLIKRPLSMARSSNGSHPSALVAPVTDPQKLKATGFYFGSHRSYNCHNTVTGADLYFSFKPRTNWIYRGEYRDERHGGPQLTPTYLGIINRSRLSGSPRFPGQSSVGDIGSSTDGGTGRDPIANLAWNDLDQGYSGVIWGAIMYPVLEVTEERRDPI